ncbi:MAG: MFS transporter [Clostridium sp.]|jgi:Na+/melibiose symporter-like transporter|nr:MFS transporter [Clostridium sp.]
MGFVKTFLSRKIVNTETGEETYLTWKEALGYAMGRGGQGMSTSIMSSDKVNYFMTNILGLRPDVAGNIRLFCGIWDAVNDPIIGVLVDKTRTKYGKMRPYIKWAPFVSALFTLMFFLGQPDWNPTFKLIFMLIAYVGWDMAYTAVDVPIGALAYSMSPNGIERTKLFGISAIGRAVLGAIAGGIVPVSTFIFSGKNTGGAYTLAAFIACFGMVLLTRPTFYWTKERANYSEDIPSVKECIWLLLHNKPLLMLVISNILFIFTTLPAAVRMYFAVDVMNDSHYVLGLEIAAAPSPILAGLLVPLIAQKFGKRMDFKRFYMICCAAAAAVHLLLYVSTRGELLNNGNEPEKLWIGILVCLQIGLSVIPLEFKNLCSKEMEAETVDYMEKLTGKRTEGVMLSLISFTGKLQNSASSAIALWLLAWSNYNTHDDAVPTPQEDPARATLFAMFTIIPAIAWLLMLIPLKFYNTKINGAPAGGTSGEAVAVTESADAE